MMEAEPGYVVIDTETTGLPHMHADVGAVQLGMVLVWQGMIQDSWQIMVRPGRWPPPDVYLQALAVHKLSRERIEAEGVPPLVAWNAMQAYWARWQAIVPVLHPLAWNARFDVEILARLAGIPGLVFPDAPLGIRAKLDTAPGGCLMRAWQGWRKGQVIKADRKHVKKSLEFARKHHAITSDRPAHDALVDATVAGEVLICMQKA
jgi:DNA polymerase III epsilon subunit-like protein